MRYRTMLAIFAVLSSTRVSAGNQHSVRGIVLESVAAHHSLLVSCDPISGYMDAMEMSFTVRDPKILTNLTPGMAVSFLSVTRGGILYAEQIKPSTTANFESEPTEAGVLTALNTVLNPEPAQKEVRIGEQVPDFALTDQAQKEISLSQFKGKVIALTFGYSRCPNPNYCYRLSDNLAQIQKRFRDRAGRDLVLLTIAIDPEHDQGAVLNQYANTWRANHEVWHFLTGPPAEVKRVAGMFGLNFWNIEGTLTHSLHTVIIDRNRQLAANIEGNRFTSKQLGDLVDTVIKRP
jgi:protein SCO1